MTLYNTLKEEPTNKNHYDDNYSAPLRDARSFAFFDFLYNTYLALAILKMFEDDEVSLISASPSSSEGVVVVLVVVPCLKGRMTICSS